MAGGRSTHLVAVAEDRVEERDEVVEALCVALRLRHDGSGAVAVLPEQPQEGRRCCTQGCVPESLGVAIAFIIIIIIIIIIVDIPISVDVGAVIANDISVGVVLALVVAGG